MTDFERELEQYIDNVMCYDATNPVEIDGKKLNLMRKFKQVLAQFAVEIKSEVVGYTALNDFTEVVAVNNVKELLKDRGIEQ